MLTVYGIKNCDSVKKARAWLEQNQVEYHFHDYKTERVTLELLNQFAEKAGWETLLNKRSSTWRKLDESKKTDLNAHTALQLLLNYPTLIKRPIAMSDTLFLIGFVAEDYQNTLL